MPLKSIISADFAIQVDKKHAQDWDHGGVGLNRWIACYFPDHVVIWKVKGVNVWERGIYLGASDKPNSREIYESRR